jgi:hypothetical protein
MDIPRSVRRLRGLLHVGLALYTALVVTVVVRTVDGLIDLQRGAWVAFDDGGFGFGEADVAALWVQWNWLWALVWVFWLAFLPALNVVVRAVVNVVGPDDTHPLSAFLSVLVPAIGIFSIDPHLVEYDRWLADGEVTTMSAPSSGPSLEMPKASAPKRAFKAFMAGGALCFVCIVAAISTSSQALVLIALAALLLPLPLVRVAQLWRWRSLLRDVQTHVDDDAVGHVGVSAPVGG